MPNASGCWFGNEAWPSGASPGAFARDVFRIEKCKTDKERAFAFYRWMLRCMLRGNIHALTPGFGGMVRSYDPLTMFLWGGDECTSWGYVAVEALQAAGMKARRAVVANSSHTLYEVWYRGDDGREGWHVFDPFLGWHLTNDRGEVVSLEELNANPDLAVHPRKGSSTRIGHHPERNKVYYPPYSCGDNLDIVQPLVGDETAYFPQIGQTYSTLWRPELPELAWKTEQAPEGQVCDIALYDENGKPRHPEHLPYWKNYAWPSQARNGETVRWHGSGALRWEPLLHGSALPVRTSNAIFENGTLRPAGPRKACEVWYRIQLPYPATYLRINPFVQAGGDDLIGFSVSTDLGKSREGIHWGPGKPDNLYTYGNGNGKSVRGLRDFYFRVDISPQAANSAPVVQQLQITVGYHCNMQLLPRLLPGKNELFLQAQNLTDSRLTAEWAYSTANGEHVESIALEEAGRAGKNVFAQVEEPEHIVMRGVTLRCQPKRKV